jgi:hypothetical protein
MQSTNGIIIDEEGKETYVGARYDMIGNNIKQKVRAIILYESSFARSDSG